jgi:hypothetical protein
MFGKPEKFTTDLSLKSIDNRTGIVSFFVLYPGLFNGGHIDIISPEFGGKDTCGSGCHWRSKEVWFWPLK